MAKRTKLFHQCDDLQVILRCKGVYKQVPIYSRGSELFAKHGAGFIRLCSGGGTSHSTTSWLDMDTSGYVQASGGHINAPFYRTT